jgi:type VI secretion system protein VasG
MIDAILTNTVLPELSRDFLNRMSNGIQTKTVTISVKGSDFEYRFEG